MNGERRIRLAALACAAALQAAYSPLAGQRPVGINEVRRPGWPMPMCGAEPAYLVNLRNGSQPLLEYEVVLKAAPDTLSGEEVEIRIDLVDADGQVVEMVDSTEKVTRNDPPWSRMQSVQSADHQLPLENRRPNRAVGSRFRIRVSIPSTKAKARESPVFQLYWGLKQQMCKSLEAPEVR